MVKGAVALANILLGGSPVWYKEKEKNRISENYSA